MNRLIALSLVCMLLCGVFLFGCGSSSKPLTLNVYNWGEYISDGSEGSFNTIREFEKWYEETYKQKVKVNYTTFASNEDMYAKLSSGAVSFDVHSLRLHDRTYAGEQYAAGAGFQKHSEL